MGCFLLPSTRKHSFNSHYRPFVWTLAVTYILRVSQFPSKINKIRLIHTVLAVIWLQVITVLPLIFMWLCGTVFETSQTCLWPCWMTWWGYSKQINYGIVNICWGYDQNISDSVPPILSKPELKLVAKALPKVFKTTKSVPSLCCFHSLSVF